MRGGSPFAWEPDKGSFIGVMRRDASVDTVRWFEAPVAYVFHPMNAWEEGSKIQCDVMEYPHAPLFPAHDGSELEEKPAVLVRWTVDLDAPTAVVRRTQLDDLAGEFPRFDERRTGLPYRHGYFAAYQRHEKIHGFDSVAHIDLATGAKAVHQFAHGDVPGEPVFVPRSAAAPEGDGWLLSVVYRAASDTSDLVVMDAQDVAAGPVAAIHVPRRVPYGFHGNWANA
jgi:carotenoid cleavage dioxygenase-like enzyme